MKSQDQKYEEAMARARIGEVRWLGEVPTACNGCECGLTDAFYDMKTKLGPWGILCEHCAMHGIGIGRTGSGLGQKFERVLRGGRERWVKTLG